MYFRGLGSLTGHGLIPVGRGRPVPVWSIPLQAVRSEVGTGLSLAYSSGDLPREVERSMFLNERMRTLYNTQLSP